MNHDVAVSTAREIADRVLAPAASQNDKQGRFSAEAVEALGKGGLLGLMLPIKFGGGALGPRTFAGVTATLAEADASAAMVYLMHVCAAATIVAARSELHSRRRSTRSRAGRFWLDRVERFQENFLTFFDLADRLRLLRGCVFNNEAPGYVTSIRRRAPGGWFVSTSGKGATVRSPAR